MKPWITALALAIATLTIVQGASALSTSQTPPTGPGVVLGKMASMPERQVVQILEQAQKGWAEISATAGQTGWLNATFLR
jgi:hypothetical protein